MLTEASNAVEGFEMGFGVHVKLCAYPVAPLISLTFDGCEPSDRAPNDVVHFVNDGLATAALSFNCHLNMAVNFVADDRSGSSARAVLQLPTNLCAFFHVFVLLMPFMGKKLFNLPIFNDDGRWVFRVDNFQPNLRLSLFRHFGNTLRSLIIHE